MASMMVTDHPAIAARYGLDRITVKPFPTHNSAVCSIRHNGFSVSGIWVNQRNSNFFAIDWPTTVHRGQKYSVCTPDPEIRDTLEKALRCAYEAAMDMEALA